jgi:hypothetical protein
LVDRVGNAIRVRVRLGAPVFVLELVLRLRLHRALVGDVGDAVLVVVDIRAAVLVLERVLVLGSGPPRGPHGGLGTLDPVDRRRHDAAGVPRAFAGEIEPTHADGLAAVVAE